MKKNPESTWESECLKWRGRVLDGKYSHFCWEWDGLPVDEKCVEFASCLCYSDDPDVKPLQEAVWAEYKSLADTKEDKKG